MLEGNTNATYWDWKDSIGPLKDRPGFPGVWNYRQTNGLGLVEYLEWAEDVDLQIGGSTSSDQEASMINVSASQSSPSGQDLL